MLGDVAPEHNFERKQSDPPAFMRKCFFNCLKLDTNLGNNFSAGNASHQEPHSAVSFCENTIEDSNEKSRDFESPENQTPTLPSRKDSDDAFFHGETDLDKELLEDQEPNFMMRSAHARLQHKPDSFSPDIMKEAFGQSSQASSPGRLIKLDSDV